MNKPNIVYVDFGCEKCYPYINDKFDLEVGDKVYVDGKLAGKIGVVTEVLTKFKVNLKYYKYVLQKVDYKIEGTFMKMKNLMVGVDESSISFEQLLTWVKAPLSPDAEPEEFLCGDGYEIDLETLLDDDCKFAGKNPTGIDDYLFWNAEELVEGGDLKFVTVQNGIGHAVIDDEGILIVDFRFDGKTLTDIYCTCMSPKLCEEMVAAAIAMRLAIKKFGIASNSDFTVIESELFEEAIDDTNISITIEV